MIRIVFSKKGYARYISHLDLQRTMQRAIKRAGIPIWMTEGFNPHPYLYFSPPLSVGLESSSEFLDIKLAKPMTEKEMKTRLADSMPEGLAVLEVYEANTNLKNICYAEYKITIAPEQTEILQDYFDQPEILLTKKTKKSEMPFDLKKETEITNIGVENGYSMVTILFPCGNEKNINPRLFTDDFQKYTGNNLSYYIERTAFYDNAKQNFR